MSCAKCDSVALLTDDSRPDQTLEIQPETSNDRSIAGSATVSAYRAGFGILAAVSVIGVVVLFITEGPTVAVSLGVASAVSFAYVFLALDAADDLHKSRKLLERIAERLDSSK